VVAQSPGPPAKRRGAQIEPPNRFESARREGDFEHLEFDEDLQADQRVLDTQVIPDQSKSLLTENNSPDVGFRWSINPYRGCEHGCVYCYARPTHEMLGMNAGLDFETKIMVKLRAAELLRDDLASPKWQPQPIAMSGVTDCYQPLERQFRLTRSCLEVLLEARQPVTVVTKNALVLRDLDLLVQMAQRRLIHVSISVTTLDDQTARMMEPRTSRPAERLRAIRELNQAGVPVRVMIAPIIPGLTDSELPEIMHRSSASGAQSAGYILLRLPWSVRPVFLDWLEREFPLRKRKIESHIRAVRGGRLNDPRFGSRMRGHGPIAEQIRHMFSIFSRKYGLDSKLPELDCSQFRAPRPASGQLSLF
jgi:DNA repair photolyase